MTDLREFVAAEVRDLLDDRLFMDALSGYFDPDVAFVPRPADH